MARNFCALHVFSPSSEDAHVRNRLRKAPVAANSEQIPCIQLSGNLFTTSKLFQHILHLEDIKDKN